MNTFLWIAQGLLAAFFIMPAFTKLTTPKAKLIEKGQAAPNGNVLPVRVIGLMELLGAAGIIFPWLLGILPVLTPVAAVGFCIVMAAAFAVHFAKKEYKILPMFVIVFILSGAVAYFRFVL
jgi:hypothetical protein